MGGETRGRKRDRSSSSEDERKKLKKNRRYRKKTYSSDDVSSDSDHDRKRASPEKKRSKAKAKKKSRESPSPEKKKKRRRSSSHSSVESSPEKKVTKKKKASRYDSDDDYPEKKKKKRHRDSHSRSKSPVKEKVKEKSKDKLKDNKEGRKKGGHNDYESDSDNDGHKRTKGRNVHRNKDKERDEKGSQEKDKDRNGDYRKDRDRNDEDKRKGRDSDKHKETSSKNRDARDTERERKEKEVKDRDKWDKDKDHKEKERDKDRERERDREKDRDKDRDKDREKDRDKDREKDREKEREKDREKDRDRERDREDGDRHRRDKDKDRGKDKDKERSKTRDSHRDDKRDRDRDRDRERHGQSKEDKYRSKKHEDKGKSDNKGKQEGDVALDDIEDEMKKRKERVEQWRLARQQKDDKKEDEEMVEGKKWSLEDDDDDDADDAQINSNQNKDGEEDEEIDPLDAYMKEVQKEVKKFTSFGQTAKAKGKTTTIVTTVVKKEADTGEKKPEVIEQNQDLMEYSSEEEEKEDILEGAAFAAMKQKKKKELLAADHSKIYYRAFRKNFYVEVPDLAKMTPEEVDAYRMELGSIRVVGRDVPKPIRTWAQSGVNNKILEVLKKCNYEKPTPVQAQGIPSIMSGRDVIGIAKTGSGKTLAFLLPMFRHVLDQPPLEENDGPVAIIMTPTRELALQIHKETRKFCKPLGLRPVCIYGGSGISEQIAELKRGAEIIVCTPGRMIDMLTANSGRVTNCRRCTYLVLDEADRMFDMGFEPQVTKIIANIREDRQTVMFSATFPRQLEALARKLLKSPIEIEVGGRSVVCSDISQHVVVIEEDNKFLKLLELLGLYQDQGSVLVFVEKQESADILFKDLLKRGYACLSLHGGMDQFDRDSTIADFKNGNIKIMVATSVAARGLDVKQLNLVVNYDCPNHYEDYVHRVGRTGRAGNKGVAFTLLTPDEGKLAQDILKALDISKAAAPEELKKLWQEYKEQMKSEGKKIKKEKNRGFGGKGFKFDEEEEAKSNEMKKMQKWALGLQDSDDEAEAAENAMDKIEDELNKAFVDSKPKKAPPQLAPGLAGQQPAVVDKDKVKKASSIAAMLNIKISQGQNADKTQQAATQILKGGALEQMKGIGLAKQLADKVNAKLNYKAPENEKEEEGQAEPEKLEKYESEIDINDLPQQARWRITSKETISRICEVSEAGITVRGSYVPPGSKLKEGEKRLHLYIESLSERAIQIARAEVRRLLKEELIKYESLTYRPQASGRYKVV